MVGPHGAVRETLVAEPRAAVATIEIEMAPKFPKGEPKWEPKW